jgi:hypothetical protein
MVSLVVVVPIEINIRDHFKCEDATELTPHGGSQHHVCMGRGFVSKTVKRTNFYQSYTLQNQHLYADCSPIIIQPLLTVARTPHPTAYYVRLPEIQVAPNTTQNNLLLHQLDDCAVKLGHLILDFKPPNTMWREDGTFVIVDFTLVPVELAHIVDTGELWSGYHRLPGFQRLWGGGRWEAFEKYYSGG